MWGEFEAMQRQVPPLRSADMADLLAYFYATLHFAPSGDAERGKTVFEQKGCVSCHSEVLDRRARRLVDRWTQLNSPISWAERMWNHASEMDAATSNRGIRWPELSGQDIVDLIVFLNSSATPAEPPTFDIGEPELGRVVFERSCESCHSFGPGAGSTVDLQMRSRPASMTDYIAAMWNHAPAMRRRGGSTPKLRSGEMRDLMGFLFAQRYFFEQGDSRRGSQVYQDKGCAGCHEQFKRETGAPDLFQATEVYSPVTLSSAVWRHGPSMLKVMKQRAISWPEFRGREMTDLIAYLNSKLIVRIGRPVPE
jgi:cytochrome c2